MSSFGAGLRAFFYHDEYEGVAKLRDRVMDLTAELREAPNTGDIAAIDVEIDRVVREVLNKYEEGVIDDGAISAFALAMDRFRSAAERRSSVPRLGLNASVRRQDQ